MGGRALKNTFTRRYQRDEFEVIKRELINILREDFMRVDMPKFYSEKTSFGDADILVLHEPGLDMRQYITETFKPNEIFHNGDCWSFDYKELQVDLIDTERKWYNTSLMYFAYNDLGNYIGRLAHSFGLKYGQEGLWYEHNFRGQNIGKIHVSDNYRKILPFLGLSFERFQEGFKSLEEIFVYIAESPYFNWKMFQLESLNKINRDRNAKRASYMSFLEWIAKNAADENHEAPIAKDKSIHLPRIMETFPEAKIQEHIDKLEYDQMRKIAVKTKFNGGVVMELFGITGKELGAAMDGFKGSYDDYDNYILNTEPDDIYAAFDSYLKHKDKLHEEL